MGPAGVLQRDPPLTCTMPVQFTTSYLEDSVTMFRQYRQLAERAMEQVSEAELFTALDPEMNSIAIIAKHMAGNMRSRWTDFLTTDGEKPWRERDNEFVDTHQSRAEILAEWERGWTCFSSALRSLKEADFDKTVKIRGDEYSVPVAIERSLGHACYHIGQIVQLARHFAGDQWNTLTVPKGRSAEFNQQNWGSTGKNNI